MIKPNILRLIDIFNKERLDSESICISFIPSIQQVANVLTKVLLKPNFDFCVTKLGLIDIYVPTLGEM